MVGTAWRRGRSSRLPVPILAINAGLAAALVALGIALITTVTSERAARTQAERTATILRDVREALRAGLDAETGQRGYLLTGDALYLEPFTSGAERWPVTLRRLRSRLDPIATSEQANLLDEMERLAEAKLAELGETIALTQAGRQDAALRLVTSDEGKELMGAYRVATARLEAIEEAILQDALLRTERREGLALPLITGLLGLVAALLVLVLWLERQTAAATLVARDAEASRLARERADLVSRELNHRIKNIFAVMQAMVSLSARGADPETARRFASLRQRLHALALAHAATRGEMDAAVASVGDLVATALQPHDPDGTRSRIEGPSVAVPAKAVTPLGLILHELATNAVKYGALAVPDGQVRVGWNVTPRGAGDEIVLHWTEQGGPSVREPDEEGFGSRMIRLSARQLGGSIERDWREGGLHATLRFTVDQMVPSAAAEKRRQIVA